MLRHYVHPGLTPLKMEGPGEEEDRGGETQLGEGERTKTEFQTRNLSNPTKL